MEIHVLYVGLIVAAFSVISAVVAITLDRRHYQDKKIKEWSEKNEKFIAELQQKTVAVQNRLNTMYGQLLALGIKLPQGVREDLSPAPAPVTALTPAQQAAKVEAQAMSEKRYE